MQNNGKNMITDIVRPKGNEKCLVAQAKKLGYERLICFYDDKFEKQNYSGIDVQYMSSKKGMKIEKASIKVRSQIEHPSVKCVYDVEYVSYKDYMHHRGGAINQVLAKLMGKNGTVMIININKLMHTDRIKRSMAIGRIAQNAIIMKKASAKICLCSFASTPLGMRSPNDMKSLGTVLGLDEPQAKDCLKPDIF